jgi:hypothetical protein
MMKIYRKILRNYADNGLEMTLTKIVFSIIGLFYQNKAYRIYRKNIARHGAEKGSPSNEFDFHLLEIHEDDLIKQIEAMEEWLSGLISKLQAGSIAWLP